MPGLEGHGLAAPLQGAFPPQGPRSRAGPFLLRSSDLSELTTSQATSDAHPGALPLRLAQRFCGLNSESAEAPPCQRCRQLRGPQGTQPTHEEPSAAHPAGRMGILDSSPSALHSHTPPPGRGADKRRIQIRHNNRTQHFPALRL